MSWAVIAPATPHLFMSSLNKSRRFVKKLYMWYEVTPDRHGTEEKYRVMVHRPDPEIFHVYVDKNFFRRFTLETMPDKLKECLAMIHTFDWDSLGKDFFYAPLDWNSRAPEHMKEIGWMTSREEYCVMMDKSLLDELRGMSASNDALKEAV